MFLGQITSNMAVLLCLVFVHLYVCNVQSVSKTCEYRGRDYTECDLMFWTGWNTCTDGHGRKPTQCAVGMEKRQKAICCPRNSLNETQAKTTRRCQAETMILRRFDFSQQLFTGTIRTCMPISGSK